MTDAETAEVATIITHALFTYRAPASGDSRLARGKHITTTLAEHGWFLVKEDHGQD